MGKVGHLEMMSKYIIYDITSNGNATGTSTFL